MANILLSKSKEVVTQALEKATAAMQLDEGSQDAAAKKGEAGVKTGQETRFKAQTEASTSKGVYIALHKVET